MTDDRSIHFLTSGRRSSGRRMGFPWSLRLGIRSARDAKM